MLLVVGSTGEKPPAGGGRESWLFVFLPSDYAPGEARCGHLLPVRVLTRHHVGDLIAQALMAPQRALLTETSCSHILNVQQHGSISRNFKGAYRLVVDKEVGKSEAFRTFIVLIPKNSVAANTSC